MTIVVLEENMEKCFQWKKDTLGSFFGKEKSIWNPKKARVDEKRVRTLHEMKLEEHSQRLSDCVK